MTKGQPKPISDFRRKLKKIEESKQNRRRSKFNQSQGDSDMPQVEDNIEISLRSFKKKNSSNVMYSRKSSSKYQSFSRLGSSSNSGSGSGRSNILKSSHRMLKGDESDFGSKTALKEIEENSFDFSDK